MRRVWTVVVFATAVRSMRRATSIMTARATSASVASALRRQRPLLRRRRQRHLQRRLARRQRSPLPSRAEVARLPRPPHQLKARLAPLMRQPRHRQRLSQQFRQLLRLQPPAIILRLSLSWTAKTSSNGSWTRHKALSSLPLRMRYVVKRVLFCMFLLTRSLNS